MKPGRVVVLLAGRHAGKKAIIVRQHDEGMKVCFHNLINCDIGQKVPPRFGSWHWKVSFESDKKNELEEGWEKIKGEGLRQVSELQPLDSH
jgi:hypothetical protein